MWKCDCLPEVLIEDQRCVLFVLNAVCFCRAATDMFRSLHGVTVSEKELLQLGGMENIDCLTRVASKYAVSSFDLEQAKKAFAEYCHEQNGNISRASQVFPPPSCILLHSMRLTTGALQLVQACSHAGLKTALVSSRDILRVGYILW